MQKIAATLLFALGSQIAWTQAHNGFDLRDSSIPPEQILPGGPPRDGIPAIDDPVFESPDESGWLDADARVLGLALNGVQKAYPIAILNWHEVVNDRFGNIPVAITFCPLCGTGMAFEARSETTALEFGVSGLLHNSDVLLYDRQTESLWSQIMATAISGPLQGGQLRTLPLEHTTIRDWADRYPDTLVLNRDTGYRRDYSSDPYVGYSDSRALMFPVVNSAPGPWHPKEWVLGVSVGDRYKAYPFSELARSAQRGIVDELAGIEFEIIWDEGNQSARMVADDAVQPALMAYWFAWYAFHPDTEVYRAANGR